MSLVVARLTRGNYLLVTLVTCELGEDVHVPVYCILYYTVCILYIVSQAFYTISQALVRASLLI